MKLFNFCSFVSLEKKQSKNNNDYFLLVVKDNDKEYKVCVFNESCFKINLDELKPGTQLEIVYNYSYKNNVSNLFVLEVNK